MNNQPTPQTMPESGTNIPTLEDVIWHILEDDCKRQCPPHLDEEYPDCAQCQTEKILVAIRAARWRPTDKAIGFINSDAFESYLYGTVGGDSIGHSQMREIQLYLTNIIKDGGNDAKE